MSQCLLCVCVLALTACSLKHEKSETVDIGRAAGKGAAPPPRVSKPEAVDASVIEPSNEADSRLASLFNQFGIRFARSPEDDRLTSLVSEYMKHAKVASPPNPQFFISRRAENWVVSVLDLEAIREGRRPTGVSYIVSERHGKLRILYGDPPL
jgi:hypothetical protein